VVDGADEYGEPERVDQQGPKTGRENSERARQMYTRHSQVGTRKHTLEPYAGWMIAILARAQGRRASDAA